MEWYLHMIPGPLFSVITCKFIHFLWLWNKINSKCFQVSHYVFLGFRFSIYEKLIQFCGIDELGTNYPKDMFDPHGWSEDSYYEALGKLLSVFLIALLS